MRRLNLDIASPDIHPLKPEYSSEIFALDQHATGENRSELLLSDIKRGWGFLSSDRKTVRGFYLPNLGDGVIVAENSKAGSALMKLRLATGKRVFRIDE